MLTRLVRKANFLSFGAAIGEIWLACCYSIGGLGMRWLGKRGWVSRVPEMQCIWDRTKSCFRGSQGIHLFGQKLKSLYVTGWDRTLTLQRIIAQEPLISKSTRIWRTFSKKPNFSDLNNDVLQLFEYQERKRILQSKFILRWTVHFRVLLLRFLDHSETFNIAWIVIQRSVLRLILPKKGHSCSEICLDRLREKRRLK